MLQFEDVLHQRAVDALMPLVAGDCERTLNERLGAAYNAHLTLAMRDIPATQFDEILAFCRELEPIGPGSFMAERLHLYAFESGDWHGEWWDSLEWSLLDSWRLVT